MAQKHLQLLRNNTLYDNYAAALAALTGWNFTQKPLSDGTPVIARYKDEKNNQKTLLGVVNNGTMDIINNVSDYLLRNYAAFTGDNTAIAAADDVKTAIAKLEKHIQDVALDVTVSVEASGDTMTQAHLEVASALTDHGDTFTLKLKDVASATALTQEIIGRTDGDEELSNRLGTGVTTANTATAQFAALSGNTSSTSAETSVEGAKKYTDEKISELSGIVDSLKANSVSGDSKVVIDVTQENGQITATAANLTGVKLDGLTAGTDTDIAATDTLGEALANLQAQINAMDKNADAVAGQVVTTVAEADGKVTETKANVKDLQLGGYVKDTSATGAIAGTDTVNAALSKLENQIGQNAIGNEDRSINVSATTNGTDINVNIKSGEHVLAKTGGNGLYTDIKLSGITPSSTTVKEEYALLGTDGTQLGETVKVYKDSSLVSMELVSGGTAAAPKQYLRYIYVNNSGDTAQTDVDVSLLLAENEFKSGVTVDASGIAHGVVDPNSEKNESNVAFLTVGAGGFKLSGVQNAIDTKINKLDVTGDTAVAGQYITHINETDGKIQIGGREDIADAPLNGYSKGTAPASLPVTAADTVNGAIAKLEHQVDAAKAAATTKVVEGTDAGNNMTIASATSETDGSVTYTINLTDVASASALTKEIGDRERVDGQSGSAYTAHTDKKYISGATTLDGADVALNDAIAALDAETIKTITSTNTGCTVTVSGTGNTRNIAVDTDGSQVKLTGYEATGATGAPAATDSVNAAIAKLYNRGTITPTNSGITVDQSGSATTLTLNVSTDTAAAGTTGATYAQKEDGNAIELRDNGIFVSSNWDCGTYDEPAGN